MTLVIGAAGLRGWWCTLTRAPKDEEMFWRMRPFILSYIRLNWSWRMGGRGERVPGVWWWRPEEGRGLAGRWGGGGEVTGGGGRRGAVTGAVGRWTTMDENALPP